ncbi:MaoC family dehydratase [Frigidibacter oleivorans]|uniref:MaoC family dehydratase n=1 Tax=Frigidibacter oleivorans TaxID=2487129 RepID=UPI000F8CBFC8|nr:MaoC family dehydratase [Frigidibacter oleivorans]
MLEVTTPADLAAHAGRDLGATDWFEIAQARIDAFAELTGDDHWIHVDTARAAREAPGGRTIAHGLYLLSLVPRLQRGLFRIARRGAGLSYGYEKVRFTAPVPVGARVRLRQRLVSAVPRGGATQVALTSTFEIEGQERPALVAEGLLLLHPAG